MEFKDRYKFDVDKDFLGKGEFSRVYRATDTLLERTVALKFYTTNAADNFQILNEIKKVISFDHPNLCKYYDVEVLTSRNIIGEQERIEVGIMEYLDAGDLKNFIASYPEFTDKLLIDVLQGLAYLHGSGIVHQDLTARNILIKWVNGKPVAKITDFRNSRLIDGNEENLDALPATIEHIAPEQFNPKKYGINGKIAANLDLWSFGLIVYEVVKGTSLFGSRSAGVSAEQIMSNILNEDYLAKLESVPPKYRKVLSLCLVKEASKRVQSAADLIALLFDGEGQAGPNVFVTQQAVHPQIVYAADTKVLSNQETNANAEPKNDLNVIDKKIEAHVLEADTLPKKPQDTMQPVMQKGAEPDNTKASRQAAVSDAAVTRPAVSAENRLTDESSFLNNQNSNNTGKRNPFETSHARPAAKENVLPVRSEVPRSTVKPIGPNPTGKPSPYFKRTVKTPTGRNGEKGNASWKTMAVGLLLILIFFALILYRPDDDSAAVQAGNKTASGKDHPSDSLLPPMVEIPGGVFLMGFDGKGATGPEQPVHPVLVSDFSLGKYEVTIGDFRKFVAATGYKTTAEKEGSTFIYDNGSSKKAAVNWRHDINGNLVDLAQANLPVVHVSWYDAVAYCNWLSEKTKRECRLPTEAEWEYATLGGKRGNIFSFNSGNNLSDISWNGENAENTYHQVGGKKPNELGLFDMIGNVYEWCADWYDPNAYRSAKAENPAGPASGDKKVIRGGSWYREGDGEYYRPTLRFLLDPNERGAKVGFRVCISSDK
jgi:formylglycine-generating enzyme required for sulfatase activity/serine/threonine protein kinase